MKTILLPSGQTCKPMRLKAIYKSKRELRAYDEIYKIVARLNDNIDVDTIWEENPYVVSSVIPSDLAIYDKKLHPFVNNKDRRTHIELFGNPPNE